MKKIALVLILCLMLSFGMGVISSAEEYGVNPRYANADICRCSLDIQGNVAIAKVLVTGIDNVTSRITVNIKLEKRVLLGLWWSEEASWQDSTTDITRMFEFRKEVKSGTYRCNFEITIEGNGGATDIITDQITVAN